MEGAMFLGLLALALIGGPWVLAIVALVRLSRAQRRIEALEAAAGVGTRPPAAAWVAGPVSTSTPTSTPTPTATPTSTPTSTPPATPAAPAIPSPIPPAPPLTTEPAPLPTTLVSPPPSSLEERIALVWLTRIGALALLVGAAYFFKYAVDNAWIGPAGRVALGGLAGLAAIATGERLRPRTRALWVNAVQGAGVALLLVSTFASAALYHLVPFPAAFAAVAAIALAGGALAVRGRTELVLALALAGGLLAPVLLSTGEDRPAALLGWLLAVCAPALLVSTRLRFLAVPWLALAGTAVLFAGWYDRFFRTFGPPELLDPNLPAAAQMGAYHPLLPRLLPLTLALAHLAAWLLAWERLRRIAPRWGEAWLPAALALGQLAAFALLYDRPLGAGAAVAGFGVLAALLAARSARPALLLGAAALGGLLLALGADRANGLPRAGWILAAAAWALVHLAASGRALLARGDATAPLPVALTPALAGLGFAGLVVQVTGPEDGLLRAALAGAAAAAELALGAAALPRGRARATVLLGAALALLAAAAAFLLSGASVTLAWAALAAATAVLAARERDDRWLAGAALLFLAVLDRLVAVDLPAPGLAAARFLDTLGAQGALRPAFLLGGRTLALLGTGAALAISARSAARQPGVWRQLAAVLVTAAHACFLTLAILEARDLALRLPVPPRAGDALAFAEYRPLLAAARAAQAGKLEVVTTVGLGLYASLLVGIGFVARDLLHRWLGLGLFAVALGKLVLSDVWRLPRLLQILVFLALGALLLAAAFLYAHFGRRILGLLRDAPRGPGAALLLAAGLGLGGPAPARAFDPSAFETVRPIAGVGAAGLHAVRVDAGLWRASLATPGALADLRIAGPAGAEVPWALRPVGGADGDVELAAALVDPVILPGGATRAVVDKGRPGVRTGELRLDLAGDDFLRETRVEASDDGRSWGELSRGARVYAVRGLPEARSTAVRHPPSESRFLRVTLEGGPGDPPRILGAHPVRRAEAPPPTDGLDLPAPARRAGPDGRTSLFDLDLGAPGIPADAVVLSIGTAAFERPVRVLGSDDGATFATLGAALVYRAADREGLRVALSPAGRRFLRVEVRDQDARPLDLRAVRVEWRARELVFDAAAAGEYALYLGDRAARAPAYDLAAVLARTPGAAAAPASLGLAAPNPRRAPREAPPPFTERHRAALGLAVAAALALLALWAVRLLRCGPET